MLLGARVGTVAGAVFAVACAPSGSMAPPPDACPAGFLGSPSAAVDFDVQVLLADDSIAMPGADGSVPILEPPQGGRVVFVGVRATNVDGCGLELTGALRDPASRQVRLDRRTIDLTPTGDGWGVSGVSAGSISATITNFSNIPVCPNQWSTTDIYGHVYDLVVTIVDQGHRQLTKTFEVTPECAEPANLAECLCICRGGYVLGQACDGGGADG